tara:strand:+ start:3195 stop:3896 length:702 start_codon:yes stop_codon:yes gene_type:complete
MLKRIGKIIGVILVTTFVIFFGLFFMFDEDLPKGEMSMQADSLANKMLSAINHEAYQETRFLEWSFAGHQYYWDKLQHEVDVTWDNYTVHLHTKTPEKSIVKMHGELVDDPERSEIIDKSIQYFNNDAFWLVAPHKIFDPGTERRLIKLDNGDSALLVTYTSGGSTPGDSYLWLLDEAGLPYSWKLWVGILPVGGLEITWEDWKTTASGTLLPTMHKFFFIDLKMGNVKAWNE